MKKAIKRISACAAFVLILAMLIVVSSYLFAPKGEQESFAMKNAAANAILDEEKNTIDVLFLGDSVAYFSVSPMQLWQEQGFTSYVCATSAQYLSFSEVLLKQAFQEQSPKVVVLEANAIYRTMNSDISTMTRLEGLFSVFKFHNRWKSIGKLIPFPLSSCSWTDDLKGYVYSTNIVQAVNDDYMAKTDTVLKIESSNENYVKAISDFCKEHDAELLLVNVPNAKNWCYEKHNGIQELADKYGITYIDLNLLNDELSIDWNSDTIDKGDHLNYNGAMKTTKYLGEYLKDRYLLPDHRNDDVYLNWSETLDRYLNTVEG